MIQAFFDNIRLALGTFRSNPLRTLLTLVGIVIGVATVIAMMGLIEGLREKINKDLGGLGANTFLVTKWPPGINFNVDWSKIRRRPNLGLTEAKALRESCPSVEEVSAGDTDDGKTVTSVTDSTDGVMVGGYTPEYGVTSGLTLSQGRFYSEPDVQNGLQVAVIGADIATALFPQGNALGGEIRLKGKPFKVIGIIQRRGTVLGMVNLDKLVLITLDPFLELYGRQRSLEMNVLARSPELIPKAMDEVTALLRSRHHLKPDDPDDFDAATNDSMTSTFNSMSTAVSAAGFAICLLSLVVGGIGILNIMLVSVSERTKEIGVRKALGARRSRILMQFSIEAVVLALVGGLIGVGLGYGIAFLARWAFDFDTKVPLWAVALSLGVSSVVGLLFGIYPASRAAKLDPVEAMRAD
jgi:putative ABC transport system permease protein